MDRSVVVFMQSGLVHLCFCYCANPAFLTSIKKQTRVFGYVIILTCLNIVSSKTPFTIVHNCKTHKRTQGLDDPGSHLIGFFKECKSPPKANKVQNIVSKMTLVVKFRLKKLIYKVTNCFD